MSHRRAPGSTSSLRRDNQQRVLDLLRNPGQSSDGFSQAELARETGLSSATVSNIVRELAGAGLVDTESGSGRRGSTVRLSRAAGIVAGVDFGHSHVAVAVGDLAGQILAEKRVRLPANHRHDTSLALAASLLAELTDERVLRVGMGIPAPVSHNVVRGHSILPGWDGVDSQARAEEVFGVSVDVENDANLGALAEHRYGVASGHHSSVFVKISSGVGAGIVIDDHLFRGSAGTAGELGHLTLDEQGPICRCGGRGCLEAYTSTPTVLAMLAGQLPEAGLDGVIAAAREGHVAALRALEDAGLHLGWGVAGVVNLLNPEIVVVGGDMARAGDLLLDSARIGLRRHALDSVGLTPIAASALGERASVVGAALLAAERLEVSL